MKKTFYLQLLHDDFREQLALAKDVKQLREVRNLVVSMMDEVTDAINDKLVGTVERKPAKKPARKKPKADTSWLGPKPAKSEIAALGPLSDAIKSAGKERRSSEPVREGYFITSEVKAMSAPKTFQGKDFFVLELMQLQTRAKFHPTKGVHRCGVCKTSSSDTGYYIHEGFQWPSSYLHDIAIHNIRPTKDFLRMVVGKSYSKVSHMSHITLSK